MLNSLGLRHRLRLQQRGRRTTDWTAAPGWS